MNNHIKSVCVYCGSSNTVAQEYKDAAFNLGKILVKNNLRLVYGGGQVGLMGIISNSVMDAGGEVLGIIPRYLHEYEGGHFGITELRLVSTMHERKEQMFENSDAFVVLPGGFGTLDEICEVITWRQIRLHQKPIIFADVNGYWKGLFSDFVDHMIAEKFVNPDHKDFYIITENFEEIPGLISDMYVSAPEFVQELS